MASADQLTAIDDYVSGLQKQIDTATAFRKLLAESPELLGRLLAANGRKEPAKGKQTPRLVKGGKVAAAYFERISRFLESEHNEPQTVAAIVEKAGIVKASVIQTIYKSHAAFFERVPIPGRANALTWRLAKNWREFLKDGNSAV